MNQEVYRQINENNMAYMFWTAGDSGVSDDDQNSLIDLMYN